MDSTGVKGGREVGPALSNGMLHSHLRTAAQIPQLDRIYERIRPY